MYSDKRNALESLSVYEKKVSDSDVFTLCMQGFHFNNARDYLGISNDELLSGGNHKVVTTSAQDVLEEYFKNNQNLTSKIEGRLLYI